MADIKKVLVTGGSGKAGRWVVRDLQARGYELLNADTRPSDEVRTVPADLCDLGQTYGVVENQDAIVHLAAIPWPGGHTPEVVFRTNMMSTFNVLQAACVLGVKKVILAGSESALGFPFRFHDFAPHYLPIDEAHPFLAQDVYGIAKGLIEDLGKGYARRDPSMSIISLRFSFIQEPNDYADRFPELWKTPERGTFNLWSYVDARDVALACHLALACEQTGFDAFYIAAADTFMPTPTRELVAQYFPNVDKVADSLQDRASLLDCSRARDILGYQPSHTWKMALGEPP